MRVITFQSADVLSSVFEDGVFYASDLHHRLPKDYKDDRDEEGNSPIWVFADPEITTGCSFHQMQVLFNRWHNEMSLISSAGLADFFMIELELDKMPVHSKTHNDYQYTCVIHRILKSQVVACYTLYPTYHWYFMRPILLEKFKDTSTFVEKVFETPSVNRSAYDDKVDELVFIACCSSAQSVDYREVLKLLPQTHLDDEGLVNAINTAIKRLKESNSK